MAALYIVGLLTFLGIRGFLVPKSFGNTNVYAAGSAALFLVGVYLSLPMIWLILVLATAAIVATIVGVQTEHLTLEFNGLIFLWAAAFSSGLLLYIARAFTGAAAVVSYALERRFQADQWQHYFLDVLSAILAVGATAAFLVYGLVRLTQVAITPGASHVAVIRTLTTCSRLIACVCWFALEA